MMMRGNKLMLLLGILVLLVGIYLVVKFTDKQVEEVSHFEVSW